MVTPNSAADAAPSDPRARLARVPVGRRVVVRHLIEGGDRATDALGELVARDETAVTVRTRTQTVRIELEQVVAAKEVPPSGAGAWRIPPFLRRAGVAVLDLDGVVRTFDTSGVVADVEQRLGLPVRGFLDLAFSLSVATDMLIGRARYADWATALRERLVQDGHAPHLADEAIALWTSDHGTPIAPTLALVDELFEADTPTFIFTNGTDRVPTELERMGLSRLLPVLLSSHTHGVAKPDPTAFARAHAEIESRLGRTVGRAEVHFTDDSPANVDAARVFGWQSRVFTLPPEESAHTR